MAKEYGLDPRTVASWESDWLAAALTLMAAERGAANERAMRDERKARMARARGGRR